MQHGHAPGKAGGEAAHRLRCEGDFGDEDDGLPPLGEGQVNGPHVDFRFAAAGDAVEEERERGG